MSEPDHTTADQLDSLLREGKISESDYERLREALDSGGDAAGDGLAGARAADGGESRRIPPVLWVGLVSLGFMTAFQLGYALSTRGLVMFIAAAVSAGLVVGLYLGHKWAYVLTLFFCAAGVLRAFIVDGLPEGVWTTLLDSLVFVPVIISTRYFFPEAKPRTGENEI